MACGCSKPDPNLTTNAIACGVCPRLVRTGPQAFSLCTVDGKAPCSRLCPKGRHVGPDGTLRWLGVRWMGVPAPIRWWGSAGLYAEALGIGRKVEWAKLPQCGCLARVKGWWAKAWKPG